MQNAQFDLTAALISCPRLIAARMGYSAHAFAALPSPPSMDGICSLPGLVNTLATIRVLLSIVVVDSCRRHGKILIDLPGVVLSNWGAFDCVGLRRGTALPTVGAAASGFCTAQTMLSVNLSLLREIPVSSSSGVENRSTAWCHLTPLPSSEIGAFQALRQSARTQLVRRCTRQPVRCSCGSTLWLLTFRLRSFCVRFVVRFVAFVSAFPCVDLSNCSKSRSTLGLFFCFNPCRFLQTLCALLFRALMDLC